MVQRNQIASINACAAHFAQADYHVNVAFYSYGCHCTIFFDNIRRKETITKCMCCFKDENDTIDFKELRTEHGRKFYTLTLTKVVTL